MSKDKETKKETRKHSWLRNNVIDIIVIVLIIYAITNAYDKDPKRVGQYSSDGKTVIQYTVPAKYTGVGIFVTSDDVWLMSADALGDDSLVTDDWYVVSYNDNATPDDESDDVVTGYKHKKIQFKD